MALNLKRLKLAAETLEAYGRRQRNLKIGKELVNFDINTWYEKDSCGTSACALGILAMTPKFKRMGLQMNYDTSTVLDNHTFGFVTIKSKNGTTYGGSSAASQLFTGEHEYHAEVADAFLPEGYNKAEHKITPMDVAKKLRQIIKNHETA